MGLILSAKILSTFFGARCQNWNWVYSSQKNDYYPNNKSEKYEKTEFIVINCTLFTWKSTGFQQYDIMYVCLVELVEAVDDFWYSKRVIINLKHLLSRYYQARWQLIVSWLKL